jgi:hypothetical protein
MTLKPNGAWVEGTAVAGGDPAAGDAAEHPDTATHADSAATMHRDAAEMIGSFAGVR